MKELFILYDSLLNSVFQGQVVSLLKKRLDTGNCTQAYIITFEQRTFSKNELEKIIPDKRIEIIVLKKVPFIGSLSLRYASYQLRKAIPSLSFETVIARGPFAGWIAAREIPSTIPITIQARGLAAQEYLYEHTNNFWHRFRAWCYEAIEKKVYGPYARKKNITIQAVSKALKTYMINTWGTQKNAISIAQQDIPFVCPIDKVARWRTHIRSQLQISESAQVYVYAGSAHAWQCPEETILFFQKKLTQNPTLILLVLSADKEPFRALVEKYRIPKSSYRILTVPHQEMCAYLSAADTGLLFRKKHIINWVSRPTKALEYKAVGLKIIHNDTVAMLSA